MIEHAVQELPRALVRRIDKEMFRVALLGHDAFAAGFLAARVWGWDLERTARFACALAGISVTGFGVATALQSKAQVLALMET